MKELKKLIDLKTILSLMFCSVTCYLAITSKIEMETFMAITMAIITYYFNKKESGKSE